MMTFKEAKELLREKLGKEATFSIHCELHSTPITEQVVVYTVSHHNRHYQGSDLKESVAKCMSGVAQQNPDTATSEV